MPNDPTPVPRFNLDDDPVIQSMMAELEQSIGQQQTEMETQSQQLDAELAAAEQKSQSAEMNQPDPAQLAEWEHMEKTYGVAPEVSEATHHRAELSHELLHTAENLAEQIFERHHEDHAPKELQWFYARGSERVGPIVQSQLLQKFERGDLKWSILVWNKKLSEWTKASETELVDLSEGPPPPPLPPPLPSAKKQAQKEQKCKACGRANGPNDRFCAGCGKPLRSKRK